MICYLSLGSNLGDRSLNLQKARKLLEEKIGTLKAVSSEHETEPWGFRSNNKFLNQVVAVETDLPPEEILSLTQQIERAIGRKDKTAGNNYKDRIIDVDLLLAGNIKMKTDKLTLPHPSMLKRRFVMEPLSEIAPDLVKDCNYDGC
ncbi:MAG: 2-amino-4-hydroxy-6-hydroxymethyldihydropteridine diphosphokinase [Dysgonamonadaceae bacterium]|jgi:2-amino-4-hydroxy-6-hydroxymethyldihydropteridine diphosphokinase|nr:2-amino-4-hydroxy-6-hydroxymethyldihydropteridine diphosphokinase [Dysgonamonadaceae bacterium]